MKPRERRERGEQDLFRSRLDQIINMDQELVRLAKTIAWRFIEERCGAVYADGPGMPPLPTRLMAGLAICPRLLCLELSVGGNEACFDIAPQCDGEFVSHGDDGDAPDAALQTVGSLLEPASKFASWLIA